MADITLHMKWAELICIIQTYFNILMIYVQLSIFRLLVIL